MGFPTYTQTGGYESAPALSRDLSLGSFTAGDLLIVCVASQAQPTQTWTHDGATDRFTLLGAANGNFSSSAMTAKRRVMQAGDSATLTVAFSASNRAAWLVIRVPAGEFDSADPAYGALAGGGISQADPPNLAPGVGALDFLWLTVIGYYSSVVTTSSPTNYSAFTGYGSGTNPHAYSGGRNLNASSENPGTWTTQSNLIWVAATIAVRPAAAVPRPALPFRRALQARDRAATW